MPKPWTEFAFPLPPAVAGFGERVGLERIYHVTHTSSALRILDDRAVGKRLISDQSVLNETRTAVVWLSPDHWSDGFRYGNVRFAYDFFDIVAKRKIYWVEVIRYRTPACRFLVSDQDVSHLPVVPYDLTKDDGPLRFVGGKWWRHGRVTTEIMLDGDLPLADCRAIDFVQHHPHQCALPGGRCRLLCCSAVRCIVQVIALPVLVFELIKTIDHIRKDHLVMTWADLLILSASAIGALLIIRELLERTEKLLKRRVLIALLGFSVVLSGAASWRSLPSLCIGRAIPS